MTYRGGLGGEFDVFLGRGHYKDVSTWCGFGFFKPEFERVVAKQW
jgi:hypothetical protein